MPPPTRDQIFVSYSYLDKRWFDALVSKISPGLRDGSIVGWETKEIEPGDRAAEELQSALVRSKVALLMVCPRVREKELDLLLDEAELLVHR
jgi:internalin A